MIVKHNNMENKDLNPDKIPLKILKHYFKSYAKEHDKSIYHQFENELNHQGEDKFDITKKRCTTETKYLVLRWLHVVGIYNHIYRNMNQIIADIENTKC